MPDEIAAEIETAPKLWARMSELQNSLGPAEAASSPHPPGDDGGGDRSQMIGASVSIADRLAQLASPSPESDAPVTPTPIDLPGGRVSGRVAAAAASAVTTGSSSDEAEQELEAEDDASGVQEDQDATTAGFAAEETAEETADASDAGDGDASRESENDGSDGDNNDHDDDDNADASDGDGDLSDFDADDDNDGNDDSGDSGSDGGGGGEDEPRASAQARPRML